MADIKFSEDHEWIAVDGDTVTVGITDFAQQQLGDVVYVELPDVDADIAQKGEAGVVESVKAASDVFAPLSGKILAVNEALGDNPQLVNEDAEGEGWFFKMTLSDPGELDGLMDGAAYAAFVADQA